MSSPSPRRELDEKKPFEPPAGTSSRSLSLDEPDSDHEAPVLPPPVVAASTPYNRQRTIRIDGGRGLHVHWTRFRRRLGAGTSPSTSSLVEDSAPSSSVGPRGDPTRGSQCDDNVEVDEVIIDRNWSDEIKSSVSLSEQDISLDRPGGHHPTTGPSTDRDSVALHTNGFWGLCTPLVILRWRLFPALVEFFSPKFLNEKSELHYVKENWFMHKVRRIAWAHLTSHSQTPLFMCFHCPSPFQPLAMWSSLFLIINWAVNAALIPAPVLLIDKIFVYGVRNAGHIPSMAFPLLTVLKIAPACTLPIFVLVIYDWPRDRPNAYQVVLAISIWGWYVLEFR